MSDKKLILEYVPTMWDLANTVPKGRGYESYPSSFLALNSSSFLLHGNNVIMVKEGGEDVSAKYKTWRYWRIWSLAPIDGGYKPIISRPDMPDMPDMPWSDDNLSKIASWRDIPGFIFFENTQKCKKERLLLEFVVSVLDHPEIGGLYFHVVIGKAPGQYRVELSDAKSIPFSQWRDISQTRSPWVSGTKIVIDSGWQPLN